MLRGLVAFFLLSAVLIPSLEVSLYIPLIEAALGENVTLLCHVKGYDSGLFYWYKTNCEYMIETVAQGYFKKVDLEPQFKTLRFDIQTEGNVYSLIIRNIQKEDEGTYLCQAGEAYRMAFVNGTKLAVKQYNVLTSQETLFGNRTTAETRKTWDPIVIGLCVVCVLCLIVIAVLVFLRD